MERRNLNKLYLNCIAKQKANQCGKVVSECLQRHKEKNKENKEIKIWNKCPPTLVKKSPTIPGQARPSNTSIRDLLSG